MNKAKPQEEHKITLGKPFVNDHGTIYFLKCFQNPELFKVSISGASLLSDEKNKFSAPNKFTLVLSPEQKKNIDAATNVVKKLVAQWHKISPSDRRLASFDKETELQTVSLSKLQQEQNVKDSLDGTDFIISCDSLFVGTDGKMYLRWRLN